MKLKELLLNKRNLKSGLSYVLVFAMVFGFFSFGGAEEGYAATTNGITGSNYYVGLSGSSYDVSYNMSSSSGAYTTYSGQGYHTVLQVNGESNTVGGIANGVSQSAGGLDVKHSLSLSGSEVTVVYTITNNSGITKNNVKIGDWTDTYFGGNDQAAVYRTVDGSDANKFSRIIVTQDSQSRNSSTYLSQMYIDFTESADTVWLGQYSSASSNNFTNSAKSQYVASDNCDTGIAWSWTLGNLANGQSVTRTAKFSFYMASNNASLTYKSSNGSAQYSSSTGLIEGSYVTLTSKPSSLTVPSGATFYWTTEPNGAGTRYTPGSSYILRQETDSVYAYVYIPSFTLTIGTYTSTDGSSYTSSSVGGNVTINDGSSPSILQIGTSAELEAVPSEGYDFVGWYTGATTGTLLSTNTSYVYSVSSNTTVYARFKIKSFTANASGSAGGTNQIANSSSSSYTSTVSFNYDGNLYLKATALDGYAFKGWKSSTDATTAITIPVAFATVNDNVYTYMVTNVTSDVTYSAVFTKNTTIVFDSNGGSNVSSQKLNEEDSYTLITPSKAGNTFGGWKVVSAYDAEGNAVTTQMGTIINAGDVISYAVLNGFALTLQAQWTANNSAFPFRVGEYGYTTLEEAINNGGNGNEIVIADDATINTTVNVPYNTIISIDDGVKLTLGSECDMTLCNGEVTDGTSFDSINSKNGNEADSTWTITPGAKITGEGRIIVDNGAVLNIGDEKHKGTATEASYLNNRDGRWQYGAVIEGVEVTVKNGSFNVDAQTSKVETPIGLYPGQFVQFVTDANVNNYFALKLLENNGAEATSLTNGWVSGTKVTKSDATDGDSGSSDAVNDNGFGLMGGRVKISNEGIVCSNYYNSQAPDYNCMIISSEAEVTGMRIPFDDEDSAYYDPYFAFEFGTLQGAVDDARSYNNGGNGTTAGNNVYVTANNTFTSDSPLVLSGDTDTTPYHNFIHYGSGNELTDTDFNNTIKLISAVRGVSGENSTIISAAVSDEVTRNLRGYISVEKGRNGSTYYPTTWEIDNIGLDGTIVALANDCKLSVNDNKVWETSEVVTLAPQGTITAGDVLVSLSSETEAEEALVHFKLDDSLNDYYIVNNGNDLVIANKVNGNIKIYYRYNETTPYNKDVPATKNDETFTTSIGLTQRAASVTAKLQRKLKTDEDTAYVDYSSTEVFFTDDGASSTIEDVLSKNNDFEFTMMPICNENGNEYEYRAVVDAVNYMSEYSNEDVTLYYYPINFNVPWTVDTSNIPENLRPESVNCKVCYYANTGVPTTDTSNPENSTNWGIITQHSSNYVNVTIGDDGTGDASYPVWQASNLGATNSQIYYYQIIAYSYVMPNGDVIEAYSDDDYFIKEYGSVSFYEASNIPANMSITLDVDEEEEPEVIVSSDVSKITGLVAGATYAGTPNGGTVATFEADANGEYVIPVEWLNTTVDIIKLGNGTSTKNSDAQTITVERRALATAELVMDDWLYGQTAPTPEVTNNLGEADVTYYYKLADAQDSAYSTTVPAAAGDYIVKAVVETTGRYTGIELTKEFTIDTYTSDVSSNASVSDGGWTNSLESMTINAPEGYLITKELTTGTNGEDTSVWSSSITTETLTEGTNNIAYYLKKIDDNAIDTSAKTFVINADITTPGVSIIGMTDNETEKTFSGEGEKSISISDANLVSVVVYTGSTKEALESATGLNQTITDGNVSLKLKENTTDTWYKIVTTDSSGNVVTKTICLKPAVANTYRVEGKITDEEGKAVANAVVTIKEGNTVIKTTTTDSEGNYKFTEMENGIYSVEATQEKKKIVEECVVSSDNVGVDKMEMPDGLKNTELDIKSSQTPNITVSGLNEIFVKDTTNTDDTKGYTVNDKAVIEAGGEVTIRLEVEKKDETILKGSEIIDKANDDGKTIGMFIDFSVIKAVLPVGTEAATETKLVELPTLIKVTIPFEDDIKGKENYVLYRYHGDAVDVLSNTPNADGEKIEILADGSGMTAYLKKFSSYAVGYDKEKTETTATTTTVAAKTADTLTIVQKFAFLLSLAGMATASIIYFKRKKVMYSN